MATRTRKIPQETWDRHKETILGLYVTSDLSLDELVTTMKNDHGFIATASQFEAQFRSWNVRKNLKKYEWETVLQKIDYLASQDIRARVAISGHPVSRDRIRRARRHCQNNQRPPKRCRIEGGSRQATSDIDGSVAIEVQNSDGNWTLCTDASGEDVSSHRQQTDTNGMLELAIQEVEAEGSSALTAPYFGATGSPTLRNTPPALSPFDISNFISDQLIGGEEEGLSQLLVGHEPDADAMFPALGLPDSSPQLNGTAQLHFGSLPLRDLPFEQFERDLLSKNLQLMPRPSLSQGLGLFSGAQNLATMFHFDTITATMNANGRCFPEIYLGVSLTLRALDAILPTPLLRHENNNVAQLSQGMREVELCRTLLFSTANGFIGMNGVPFEVIPKFLDQYSNITKILPGLFRDKQNHVVKSLAENLFRAAIESGDLITIEFVLRTGLVNADEICCLVKGKKYTPLERLAKLQNLQAIRKLLQLKADSNRTFITTSKWRGALGHLIEGIIPASRIGRSHTTFSQDYLDTVDALIQAGAEIHPDHINDVLCYFVRTDLAKKLLYGSAPAAHSKLIEHTLSDIVHKFTDEEAQGTFAKILSDCERTGCKRCLSPYSRELSSAIMTGATRGHIGLVKSYFQYTKWSALILTGAIKSGNRELIKFVLDQNPNIHLNLDEANVSFSPPATPLSAAIEAGDKDLIRKLETRGALEHIDECNELSPALSAAGSIGDIDYIKVLLRLYPNFGSKDIEPALISAGISERADIVRLLLDAGSLLQSLNNDVPEMLIKAYGNKALLTDLISGRPEVKLVHQRDHAELKESLKSGDMTMLNFFSQSGLLPRDILTKCLWIAIERHDSAMLRRLLELGADPFGLDEGYFATRDLNNGDLHVRNLTIRNISTEDLDMLRILFEYAPSTKTYTLFFGTLALIGAIQGNLNRTEALELFLSCKAVDFRSTVSFRQYDDTLSVLTLMSSPLGIAITKDAESGHLNFPLTTRLLDAGCDINGVSFIDYDECERRRYKTPLLQAIETRNKRPVQFLIDRGADINKKATLGIKRTPLQAAAEYGSLDIVEFLLQSGADVNDKPAEFHGGTPLQFAAMSGNCNVAALLLDSGANPFDPPSAFGGRWPIEAAAEHGRLDMIQLLWNASSRIAVFGGISSEQCRTAISLAKENGHGGCAGLIRELAVSNGIILTLEGSG